MLYNENILYNQPQITYTGTVIVNIIGIENPIILSNLTVIVSLYEDYSNATTLAIISYDILENGILTIEATQSQASALVEAIVSSNNSQVAEITLSTQ